MHKNGGSRDTCYKTLEKKIQKQTRQKITTCMFKLKS